ncbi:MAG TPA: methionyl-tRNA formyltransferase [Burkholderiaceae bacterium]|nr:methionyl-tRNA formyltransferase [Burkholderiaceae bacterium]
MTAHGDAALPRIAFAGTPPFAAVALAALLDAGFPLPLVLTQPDRPAGRGLRAVRSAVRELAEARGLEVMTPPSLRVERAGADAEVALRRLRAADVDVLVVAAYGLILPQAVLDIPRGLRSAGGPIRALNIHASLLPRWRGAAPVARAIEAGDALTGITIMQMDAGLDTGPMLCAESVPIEPADSAGRLTARLAALGARLVVDVLQGAGAGNLRPVPQPPEGATYARKLDKGEAWLDWTLDAAQLARRVRAFDPFPGAAARLGAETIKVWSARSQDGGAAPAAPGTIVAAGAAGVSIACGHDSVLHATELQRPGGRRLAAAAFCAGAGDLVGRRFDAADEAARQARAARPAREPRGAG